MQIEVSWLNKLKIAILNCNEDDAILLLDSMPNFVDNDNLITARALIGEVINMLQINKGNLACDMNRIKQIKTFLET